jgi:hypothetical protein
MRPLVILMLVLTALACIVLGVLSFISPSKVNSQPKTISYRVELLGQDGKPLRTWQADDFWSGTYLYFHEKDSGRWIYAYGGPFIVTEE